jgi:phosphoribosylformimino-5-aminoimidazole carboxamide ribotide isomerase
MKGGKMMARDRALWIEPLAVVKALNDLELGSLILLDVARVGSGEGVDFGLLDAAASLSRHAVLVGGGVRDAGDLERIERSGASGAIVASAVHSGALSPSVLW